MKTVKKLFVKIKPIFVVMLSIFVTFAINMNWDKNIDIRYSFSGNSILYVIFFILICWMLTKTSNINNKRLKICCILLATLFASFEVVGNSINTYLDLSGIVESKITII